MNTVVFTSVLSAANHALFAGTRVLHGMIRHPYSDSSSRECTLRRSLRRGPGASPVLLDNESWNPFAFATCNE